MALGTRAPASRTGHCRAHLWDERMWRNQRHRRSRGHRRRRPVGAAGRGSPLSAGGLRNAAGTPWLTQTEAAEQGLCKRSALSTPKGITKCTGGARRTCRCGEVDMIGPDPYGVLATMSTKGRSRKNPNSKACASAGGGALVYIVQSTVLVLLLLRCCSGDRHSLAVSPCWCAGTRWKRPSRCSRM
jgi:hypothetical protein